jgi:hypothetical protein
LAKTGWQCISPLGGDGIMQSNEIGVEALNWAKFSELTQYEVTGPITLSTSGAIPSLGLAIVADRPIYDNSGVDLRFNTSDMAVDGSTFELKLNYGTGAVDQPMKSSDLFSTDAGKGSNYVGVSAITNPNFSVSAGTLKSALDGVVTAISDLKQADIDLADTEAGKGSNYVGFEGYGPISAGTLKETLDSIIALTADAGYDEYTAEGSISVGNAVIFSADETVTLFTDPVNNDNVIGVAISAASNGQKVRVAKVHKSITWDTTGMTVGKSVYWTGFSYTDTLSNPTFESGINIWRIGYVAVVGNPGSVALDVSFVKKVA